jgi:hypothetical protein
LDTAPITSQDSVAYVRYGEPKVLEILGGTAKQYAGYGAAADGRQVEGSDVLERRPTDLSDLLPGHEMFAAADFEILGLSDMRQDPSNLVHVDAIHR